MEHQIYFDEFVRPGAWVREDPEACGCRGSGWFLSQLDTWHRCGRHYTGQPDPEWDYED